MDDHLKGRLVRRIESLLGPSLATLRELVSVNSFTRNRAGVNENGRMVSKLFAPLGFDTHVAHATDPELGDHRFLTRTGAGHQEIVFISHLDTVYPPEVERANGFCWHEDEQRVYGPGVADVKGGTVVAHLALQTLALELPHLLEQLNWHVLLNAAEEEGSADFPRLARDYLTPHTLACLVLEHARAAGDGRGSLVTTSRRGSARFVVDVCGRASHAGSAHERGANAVCELAGLITRVEAATDYSRGTTFNVGRIEGGVGSNTVAGHARGYLDVRADTVEQFDHATAWIESLAGVGHVRSAADGFACRVDVTRLPSYPPWPENAASQRLGKMATQAAEAIGQFVSTERRFGASDGCHLWNHAPTLDGLGPIGENIHCAVKYPQR
ncbi:MAG: M20/M25/M40 family metallo-hydrolase [Acidobacteriota bacterium]|nr:MAG: M20/M25/M40 family metallo-hydrolase [Acidobacteriota bacterium]